MLLEVNLGVTGKRSRLDRREMKADGELEAA
jgi:hypothetical protein